MKNKTTLNKDLTKNEPSATKKKKATNEGTFLEIKIGNQIWMSQNLDVDKYRNGDEIPQVQELKQWSKLTSGAWCYYENNSENSSCFGKLYNWFAINDPRGLAPEGFHIPTHEEWITLAATLGGDFTAGGKLKEKGTKYWNSPNVKATNQSKFSAMPGGYRSSEEGFFGFAEKSKFWTSSEFKDNLAKEFSLISSASSLILSYSDKRQGCSVRCIKDYEEVHKGTILGNLEVFMNDIGEYSFSDANLECEKLGGGWRVPTKDELNILFENKALLGQFTAGFYWSSTKKEDIVAAAWGQRFEDGFQNFSSTTAKYRNFVRPVRSV
jgi:uncharacterized protein (TIGR02145 family)